MKKIRKLFKITIFVLCFAGLVMALAVGISPLKLDILREKWDFISGKLIEGPDAEYELDSSQSFDRNREIYTGDVERLSLGTGIEELEVQAGGCSFEIRVSQDAAFYLEANKAGKLQAYTEENTLHIVHVVTAQKWGNLGNSRVILYVPENTIFKMADLELGAGSLKAERVCAEEMKLDVGAGQMVLDDFEASRLTVEVGLGSLEAAGRIGGNAEIKCDVGNVELSLQAAQTDYDYDIEGAMGSIDIGAESYSGFEQAKKIENGAGRTITLDCSMGNITLTFQ